MGDFEPWKLPEPIVVDPGYGGKFLGRSEIIRKVRRPVTGIEVSIRNGRTSEQAIDDWEDGHGPIDMPTYLRLKGE